jgi:glycerol-3-phosphate O-acyltransferase / dihydroxyacetone phosphate acyltransferase
MRAELSNELLDVINSFGPKLYPDFDRVRDILTGVADFPNLMQWRILIPSAKPPPSAPRLPRRQSGATINDLHDNLLAHPMVRLFS